MEKGEQRTTCPNCNNDFDAHFKFCPNCGQENKKINLHFRYFISEFLSAGFNLDSKIFRTLKLLIFYPGMLTKEFIAGKHKSYLPPVRLYLVVSLIYFSLLSFINTDFINNQPDETEKDDQPVLFGLSDTDSIKPKLPQVIDNVIVSTEKDTVREESKIKQIFKKLNTREGRRAFNKRLPDYISMGMFILLPLTAFIFYLMFYRNTLYIHHLVFTLHLQSLMYILFIVINLIELGIDNKIIDWVNVILFLFFLLIWIKKFYGIGWFKSIWKSIVFLFFYGIVFLLFLAVVAGLNAWFL